MSKIEGINLTELRDGLYVKADGEYYATNSAPNASANMIREKGFQCEIVQCGGDKKWAIKITGKIEQQQDQGQSETPTPAASGDFDDEYQRKVAKLQVLRNTAIDDKRDEQRKKMDELDLQIAEEEKRLQISQNRPKRISMSSRDKLVAPQRPGYVRRFVNVDTHMRMTFLQRRGWVLVQDVELEIEADTDNVKNPSRLGSTPMQHVGTTKMGGSQKAVLMEMPTADYKALKAEEQADIANQERLMRKPPQGVEGGYGGLSVE